jgi:cytochrome c biogenesis factor
MIPELGHFSLIIGLAFAMLLAIVPLIGVARKDQYLVRYAWPLSYGMFFFIFLSVIALGYSFAVDDFSVANVAHHSNSELPIFFKIAAVWGGHEKWMALKLPTYTRPLRQSRLFKVLKLQRVGRSQGWRGRKGSSRDY